MLSASMHATSINNAGNVVGYTLDDATGSERSVVWTKAKSYELGVLPSYTGAIARTINSSGLVGGTSYLLGTADSRATLWTLK
jgi:uncharacterized membrane protein